MLNYLSIKKTIQEKLREILVLKYNQYVSQAFIAQYVVVEIFLKKKANQIVYKSPISLQLSKFCLKNPNIIAEELLTFWDDFLDLQCSISGNGWLEFTVGDRFVIDWLQQLPQIKFPQFYPSSSHSQIPWHIYYSHSRCCSLLRSAHRNQLITLSNIEFTKCIWLWKQPQTIPYNCGLLKFQEEKNLIAQLMIIVDNIYEKKECNWLKIASDFTKIILDFERHCRIFGEFSQKKNHYLKLD